MAFDWFHRRIACATELLKKHITDWTGNEGWKFSDFRKIVEMTGVGTPVIVYEPEENLRAFKCLTSLDKVVVIALRFGDWIDELSQIRVTDGEETRVYEVRSKRHKKDAPRVTFRERIAKRGNKELSSYYCEFFCQRNLHLDDAHSLQVRIDEPNRLEMNKPKIMALQKTEEIEAYLLGLEAPVEATQVRDAVMHFIGFTEKDIADGGNVVVSYS